MIDVKACARCGVDSRFHMLIGVGLDVVWLCDFDYKGVFTGKAPLPDGRWWAQVRHVDGTGRPRWHPDGPWVSDDTPWRAAKRRDEAHSLKANDG